MEVVGGAADVLLLFRARSSRTFSLNCQIDFVLLVLESSPAYEILQSKYSTCQCERTCLLKVPPIPWVRLNHFEVTMLASVTCTKNVNSSTVYPPSPRHNNINNRFYELSVLSSGRLPRHFIAELSLAHSSSASQSVHSCSDPSPGPASVLPSRVVSAEHMMPWRR